MKIRWQRRLLGAMLAGAVLSPVSGWAQEPAPVPVGDAGPVQPQEAIAPQQLADGTQTRAWLDLQTSNSASLAGGRPMPGEVADQVYARYLKSFTHPIPEQFEREKFVSGGGSQ